MKRVTKMEWTPEVVKAEMDYRLETARRHATVRALGKSRVRQPSWWGRLHPQQARAA